VYTESQQTVRVENLFQAALQQTNHKPLGPSDVETLFTNFVKGGVDSDSLNELRWGLDAHRKDLTPSATVALEHDIASRFTSGVACAPIEGVLPHDGAQPAMRASWPSQGVEYKPWPGAAPVGSKAITPDMVEQGALGDCSVVTALNTLLDRDPLFLAKFIHTAPDGTYSATFQAFAPGSTKPTPVTVTVDGLLPTFPETDTAHTSRNAGAHCSDPSIIDVSIFEKLFAKFRGGYDILDAGDYGGPVLRAITGHSPERTFDVFPDLLHSLPDLIRFLSQNHDQLLTAFTYCGNETLTDDPTVDYKGVGLLPDHAYALLKVLLNGKALSDEQWAQIPKNPALWSQLQVQLQNPWGELEPGSPPPQAGTVRADIVNSIPGTQSSPVASFDGKDDGQFVVPLQTVLPYLAGIEANEGPSSGSPGPSGIS
jgi:hypothetical protein